jgi:hypothetical protein
MRFFFPSRCELSEMLNANAFCLTAPSVRLSSLAIFGAAKSCRAPERNAFTSAANQLRRLFFVLPKKASSYYVIALRMTAAAYNNRERRTDV